MNFWCSGSSPFLTARQTMNVVQDAPNNLVDEGDTTSVVVANKLEE